MVFSCSPKEQHYRSMFVVPTVRRTATVADRRRMHSDRTMRAVVGRRPLQVFFVVRVHSLNCCSNRRSLDTPLFFFFNLLQLQKKAVDTPHPPRQTEPSQPPYCCATFTTETCPWCRSIAGCIFRSPYLRRPSATAAVRSALQTCFCSVQVTHPPHSEKRDRCIH